MSNPEKLEGAPAPHGDEPNQIEDDSYVIFHRPIVHVPDWQYLMAAGNLESPEPDPLEDFMDDEPASEPVE